MDSASNSRDTMELGHLSNPEVKIRLPRKNSLKFPMHAAAQWGQVNILKKQLQKRDPSERDAELKTPLHYACGFAVQEKSVEMVEAILEKSTSSGAKRAKLVNLQDINGDTALHIAARTGHPKVVEELFSHEPDLNIKNKEKKEPLNLIYEKVPSTMTASYDYSVDCKSGKPDDPNLTLTFDFGAICGVPGPEDMLGYYVPEMYWLSNCLALSIKKQEKILMHPVVQVFLLEKWKKIRIPLWGSILYHILWLILYIHLNVDLYLKYCPFLTTKDNSTTLVPQWNGYDSTMTTDALKSPGDNTISKFHHLGIIAYCDVGNHYTRLTFELWILFLITVSIGGKEIYEIHSSNAMKQYFLKFENVGQWVVILFVLLASVPIFQADDSYGVGIHGWQYQLSSFGILLACYLILSQIGKIPTFGQYLLMFAKVIRSFTMFMITYASILIAFMLSFHILMPQKPEFCELPWGFIKILVMMTGEINYDDVFHSQAGDYQLPFPISTKLLFAAFVTLVTILLCNLLIGLTVSDIQALQTGAVLSSLSGLVEEMHIMEKFLISSNVQDVFKRFGKQELLQYFLVTQYDSENDQMNMEVDIHIDRIPKHLQDDIRELSRNTYDDTDDDDNSDQDDDASIYSKIEETDDEVNLKNFSVSTIQKTIQRNSQLNDALQAFLDDRIEVKC